MGILDRDYYRDNSGGFLQSWGRQGATVWLIVITCVVFLAQIIARDTGGPPLTEFGEYNFRKIQQGEVWRLLTPLFLHIGLWHLACNMLVLYFTGVRLEDRYGGKEFVAFYLTAGVFANLVYFLVHLMNNPPNALAVGASGAVTAALVLYACHYPRQQVLLFFVIPMPVWALVLLYIALDSLGAITPEDPRDRGPKVAYVVHLAGALFGFLYFQLGRPLTGWLPGLPARSARRPAPRLWVVPKDPEEPTERVAATVDHAPAAEAADEHLEAKVDQVLAKVSQHGQESLSPEERKILFRASEIYKKRRK